MCGGCGGGGVCGGGGGGGGTVNIIFLVTYDRHQQLLFSLKNISGIPRCVTEAFYRVRNLEGSGGTPPVWGQG